LPIPREEPVIIATFPARSNNVTAFPQRFQGAAEPDQCKTDPFARTHQRLRPLHHHVNENDRWVTLHIYDKPLQRATSAVELLRENRISAGDQNDTKLLIKSLCERSLNHACRRALS
jgi:hypothetical protein